MAAAAVDGDIAGASVAATAGAVAVDKATTATASAGDAEAATQQLLPIADTDITTLAWRVASLFFFCVWRRTAFRGYCFAMFPPRCKCCDKPSIFCFVKNTAGNKYKRICTVDLIIHTKRVGFAHRYSVRSAR